MSFACPSHNADAMSKSSCLCSPDRLSYKALELEAMGVRRREDIGEWKWDMHVRL